MQRRRFLPSLGPPLLGRLRRFDLRIGPGDERRFIEMGPIGLEDKRCDAFRQALLKNLPLHRGRQRHWQIGRDAIRVSGVFIGKDRFGHGDADNLAARQRQIGVIHRAPGSPLPNSDGVVVQTQDGG